MNSFRLFNLVLFVVCLFLGYLSIVFTADAYEHGDYIQKVFVHAGLVIASIVGLRAARYLASN